ncbi:MAG: putative porin, partial [Tannerella sp.]|nr:putative porin [Tannerella sp.]
MKRGFVTLLLVFFSGMLLAQPGRRGFSPNLNTAPKSLPDSMLLHDKDSSKISVNRTTAFRVTDKSGERYIAPLDTLRLNFANSTLIDGRGTAVGYLANIGSPAQSRIFSERNENNDFIFADAYSYYITTPQNALFYDVKDPYTRINYVRAGGQTNREEMFNGVITTNFGKKINIGIDFDYTYVRGQYASNSNNLLYYRPFGSYLSDRYELHAYFRNHNYLNSENGGLTNDRYVTNPDDFTDGKRPLDPKSFPTRFTDTWNRIKGKQIFLTHRYNLGFYRELTSQEKEEEEKKKEQAKQKREEEASEKAAMNLDSSENGADENAQPDNAIPNIFASGEDESVEKPEEEEIDAVFVPVSSIIHTFEYEDNSRRFISKNANIDTVYAYYYDAPVYGSPDSLLNDYTESWSVKNTVGLSLREGFQDWVKFGLTAYVNFDKRRFTLPGDSLRGTVNYDEFSTYIGGELSKQQGKLFTYKARGELCIVGSDIGEFRIDGELNSSFRLWGKETSIKANGYIKNLTPAFYMRHNHQRYFWWDNNLDNRQRVYVGVEIDVKETHTKISSGVE